MRDIYIHPTAVVSEGAHVASGTQIWMNVQIREGVYIGENCIIGRNAYIENGVTLGDNCKIQNNALLYHDATLEKGVFIGPGAILTNDKFPRAVNIDGSLKNAGDWNAGHIHIGEGASVGAGAIVLTDIKIGAWAMIGAGALVTKDVLAHTLVTGRPARFVGYVCKCGRRLYLKEPHNDGTFVCVHDNKRYHLPETGTMTEIQT